MHIHDKYNNLLQFDLLRTNCNIFHFTTTISDGVSDGTYSSFNLGAFSGDNPEKVLANRKKLCDILNIHLDDLLMPYQTHSDEVLVIDENFLTKNKEEQSKLLENVDALITNQKGICIGATTADCVPIIIYDPMMNVLSVIHAGWRGTVACLPSKVVRTMCQLFGSKVDDLMVGIGPAISQEYFEVGDEVVKAFDDANFNLDLICRQNIETGKIHINLHLANQLLLTKEGVLLKNIETTDLCTFSHPELFYSARRQTIQSGRMLTGGMLLD